MNISKWPGPKQSDRGAGNKHLFIGGEFPCGQTRVCLGHQWNFIHATL